MKWNEVRKIAESKGWELSKHGARHDQYTHPKRPKYDVLIIGRHGSQEVAPGTLNKIRKQVGF